MGSGQFAVNLNAAHVGINGDAEFVEASAHTLELGLDDEAGLGRGVHGVLQLGNGSGDLGRQVAVTGVSDTGSGRVRGV